LLLVAVLTPTTGQLVKQAVMPDASSTVQPGVGARIVLSSLIVPSRSTLVSVHHQAHR
jgi:hypothetical protein